MGFENINNPIDRIIAETDFSSAMSTWERDYQEDTEIKKVGPISKECREARKALAALKEKQFNEELEDDFYGD